MGSKGVYLSFDFDHDDELRGSFLAQARRHTAHTIVNWSLPAAIDGKWTAEAGRRIGLADVVVFICGVNTHSAKGVEAEMTLTQQLSKPYFLLRGRPRRTCTRPRNASGSDVIHRWSWKRINRLLSTTPDH